MKIRGLTCIAACIFLLSVSVCAADPDIYTYTYNYWGNGVLSPDGYAATEVLTASLPKPRISTAVRYIYHWAGLLPNHCDHIGV